MKIGLDTSVVLRLLLGEPVDQAQRAVAFLEETTRRADQAVVCDLVVAEIYFALQYHYAVPKKEALAALRRMFEEGEIEPQGVASEILAAGGLTSAKPDFVDRLIHGTYASAGNSMATFERAAAKLKSVRVL